MINTEFWYDEGGSRAEGRSGRHGQKWWLPLPQFPGNGLSDSQRKKLMNQGKIVLQVFKAVKSINDSVLLTMPVPAVIREALSKVYQAFHLVSSSSIGDLDASVKYYDHLTNNFFLFCKSQTGKECLGEELYSLLASESKSPEETLDSLNVQSEQQALDIINKLEEAAFAWRERLTKQVSGSSPVRTSWPFFKDPVAEIDKMELHLENAELLQQALKSRLPNLPQSFLNVTKIKYGKVKSYIYHPPVTLS